MDLGKMAYYKADELEQRLNSGDITFAVDSRTFSVQNATGAAVAQIKGSGLLIVEGDGNGTVFAGDREVAGGNGKFFSACAVDKCKISASGSMELKLTVAGIRISIKEEEV